MKRSKNWLPTWVIGIGALLLLAGIAMAVTPALRVNGIDLGDGSTLGVSASGHIVIRNNAGTLQQSVSGGAYTGIGGGGGGTQGGSTTASHMPYASAGNTLADTNISYTAPTATQSLTAIGTAQTVGTNLTNATAAALGAQQFSPMLELTGQGWGTTGGASQSVAAGWQVTPIQGTTASGDLSLYQQNGGGALTQSLQIAQGITNSTSSGMTVIGQSNAATGAISFDTGNSGEIFFWSGVPGVRADQFPFMRINGSGLFPLPTSTRQIGDTLHRWLGLYNSGRIEGGYNSQSGTTYTLSAEDHYVGLSNTAARTVTLIAANTVDAGTIYLFKDEAGTAATGNITITRAGTDTIDGATSLVISVNYGKAGLVSNGVGKWFQVQ